MSSQREALPGTSGTSGRGPSSPVRLGAMVVVLLAVGATGCSSKLPGPAECERVALRASGIRSLDQLRFPHVRETVENLTHECLTTPFDRETVRCMEEVGAFQICIRDFILRHPERVRRAKP